MRILRAALAVLALAAPLAASPPHLFLQISGDPPSQQLYVDRIPPLPPLRLSCEMPTAGGVGHVFSFSVSPDGLRVVYVADATRDQINELWSVAITGGPCVMISNRYQWGERDFDVRANQAHVSPDSARAVYIWGWTSGALWELWSAPVSSANGAIRISQPGVLGRGVRDNWTFRGGLVRYASDIEVDETPRWYVAPVDGRCVIHGTQRTGVDCILRELFTDGFESGNTGGWS